MELELRCVERSSEERLSVSSDLDSAETQTFVKRKERREEAALLQKALMSFWWDRRLSRLHTWTEKAQRRTSRQHVLSSGGHVSSLLFSMLARHFLHEHSRFRKGCEPCFPSQHRCQSRKIQVKGQSSSPGSSCRALKFH